MQLRLFVCTALATVVDISILSSYAKGDWNTFQGDAGHTGFVPGAMSPANANLLWNTQMSSFTITGIAVGGGTVFETNNSESDQEPNFHAVDEITGAALWSKTYNVAMSNPGYANGVVYFQTDGHSDIDGNYLHAYAGRTGANIFDAPYDAQWETYLNPTPFNGNIYVGGGYYGGMYSFNATSGQQNWFGYVGQYDGWTPAVDSKYAYSFTGSGDTVPIYGQFRMINLATGVTQYLITDTNYAWDGYTMNSAVVLGQHNDAFSINPAGVVYPNFTSNGRLIEWDLRADATHTPHIGWVLSDKFDGQPTLANGVLYANDGGKLAALDELTGNSLWNWTPPSGSIADPMIATDNMIFVSTTTATYAIDLASHQPVWSYPVSGTLALSDNILFVGGSNGTLYAFSVPEPANLGFILLGFSSAVLRLRPRSRIA